MTAFEDFIKQQQGDGLPVEQGTPTGGAFADFVQRGGSAPQQTGPGVDIQEAPVQTRQPFIEREGILQSILKAPINLGRDIAQGGEARQQEEESANILKQMSERVKNADLNTRSKQVVANILDGSDALMEVEPARNRKQILGDILGTALFVAPIGQITAGLRGASIASQLGRGAIVGGAFGGTEALSQDEGFGDTLKEIGIGAAFGAPFEVGGVALGKGTKKLLSAVSQKGKQTFSKIFQKKPDRVIASIGRRLERDFGKEGKKAVELFNAADDNTLLTTGKDVDKLIKGGVFDKGVTKESKNKLVDAWEGRLPINDQIPNELQPLAKEAKKFATAEEFVQSRVRLKDISLKDLSIKKSPKNIISESSNKFGFKEIRSKPNKLSEVINLFDSNNKNIGGIKKSISVVTDKPFIAEIFIEPKFRGKGIAQHLFQQFPNTPSTSGATISSVKARLKQFGFSNLTDFFNKAKRISTANLSENELKMFKAWDEVRKDIAGEAVARKIPVRTTNRKLKLTEKTLDADGKVIPLTFTPKQDFFPHAIPNTSQLRSGKVRQDVIKNSVRIGAFKDKASAQKTLDSMVQFIDSGGRQGDDWIEWLVKSGQASTKTEARGKALRFFKQSRDKKFGPLEFARDVESPFWDPDPTRVLPLYTFGARGKLAELDAFGHKFKEMDKIIGRLSRAKGEDVAAEFTELIKRANGIFDSKTLAQKEKTVALFKTLQLPKLAFAQIANASQSVNTLLKSDAPSFFRGLGSALTQTGRNRALKTGATLESVLNETLQAAGAGSSFGNKFLKLTGFTATEKANRIIAANTGIKFAERTFNKFKKNPKPIFRARLEELGINADEALTRGVLSEDELLKAGLRLSNLTQFRSRPIDLPFFASSPEGKLAFQFKNFAFNQTKFIKNRFKQQLANKNFKGLARDLIVIATIFPMTGEVVGDIRSLATGSKRPTEALDRYLSDVMLIGGFGILGDTLSSAKYGKLAESLLGPTFGTVVGGIEKAASVVLKKKKVTNADARFLLQQTGFGRVLANTVFENDRKEGDRFIKTLTEAFEE